MASRRVRRRGMEPPYAVDQISACILHPIISAVSEQLASIVFNLESSFSFTLLLAPGSPRTGPDPLSPLVVPLVPDTSADFWHRPQSNDARL